MKRLGLVLLGIVVGFIVLEVGLRLILPPANMMSTGLDSSYQGIFTCSPTVGWVGKPHYRGLYTKEEFSHFIQFNALGMYDTEHTMDKDNNTFRILLIGDSYAQGLQVPEEQTAHQQLENMLNQHVGNSELSFEVISMAVLGWGTGQQLVFYRELGRLYKPDLVLLLFHFGNDIRDNVPGEALTLDGFNCFAPYFPICANSALDPEPWSYIPGLDPAWGSCSRTQKGLASGLSLIQKNSYLFARIEPLILLFKERRVYNWESGRHYVPLYLPDQPEELRYAWRVTEGLLSQFVKEVREDGANFAVALIAPQAVIWLGILDEAQLEYFFQSEPYFAEADIDRPNLRLTNFLHGHNIPTLDLQQPMIDHIAATGAELYLPIDSHWTVDGNRVAAELMFAWLVEGGLVKGDDSGN